MRAPHKVLVTVIAICLVAVAITGCGRSVFNEGSAPIAPTGPAMATGGSPINQPEGLTLIQLPRTKPADRLLEMTKADGIEALSAPDGFPEWHATNDFHAAPATNEAATYRVPGKTSIWLTRWRDQHGLTNAQASAER